MVLRKLYQKPSFPPVLVVTSQPSTFASPSFSISVSGPALTGGTTPNLFTSPNVTRYSYDLLDNLTCVVQKGTDTTAFTNCASASATWRPRTFVYDSLSRMTSVTNPESGTITYTYDANDNLLTETDARGITATMTYEALNRLLSKTYSDGTPTVTYSYDQNSVMGNSLANSVGRLTYSHTPNNSTASIFSYDPNGRIKTQWQCVPRTCGYEMDYAYNFAGDVTSQPTGTGIYLTQGVDGMARVTQVTSSWVDANHPATLISGVNYSPASALATATYGNNLSEAHAYNNVLQPCRINVNSSATAFQACTDAIPNNNILDLNAGFNAGSSDDGNVASFSAFGQ